MRLRQSLSPRHHGWHAAAMVLAISFSAGGLRAADTSEQISRSRAATARRRALDARSLMDRQLRPGASLGNLITEPARWVEARYGFAVDVPQLAPTAWVAFAAVPPNLPSQRIAIFNMLPRTLEVPDLQTPDRRLMMALLSTGNGDTSHKFHVGIFYRAQLFRRTFVPAARLQLSPPPATVPPLSTDDARRYLAPSDTLDFQTDAFQAALAERGLRPRPGENTLQFATRAFTTLKHACRYDFAIDMDRRSSNVLASGVSDCGGLNGLFVSTMRANGIPARALCGRWALSAKPGERLGGTPYLQNHVKAELFLDTVGWIPVDLSGAVQLSPPADSGLAYFGSDAGRFLTMHVDFDLRVDTIAMGRQTLHGDQGIAYWIRGQGSLGGRTGNEFWQVTEIPPPAPAPVPRLPALANRK